MSLLSQRRPAPADPRDAEVARLCDDNERLTGAAQATATALAASDEKLGRALEYIGDLRAALKACETLLWPDLADLVGDYADDPIPADATVSKDPTVHDLRGDWAPVPGDNRADWAAVEPVDFGAVLAGVLGGDLPEGTGERSPLAEVAA